MTNKLYKLMNWPLIEEIIYSESDRPKDILGPHQAGTLTLVQAFFPEAKRVTLCVPKLDYEVNMDVADEDGFFTALVPTYGKFDYYYMVKEKDGETRKVLDAYIYDSLFNDGDLERFAKGIHYSVYRLLGAHVYEIDGILGTHFAVWAPNAMRVSVVGDFNGWDGRVHQMQRVKKSGIFEIFIPGVDEGAKYKFEIKLKNCLTYLKKDPYCFKCEDEDDGASIVAHTEFKWDDNAYILNRAKRDSSNKTISVMRIELKKELGFKEVMDTLPEKAKELGYTHVLLSTPFKVSKEGRISDFYCFDNKLGENRDFVKMVDAFHKNKIGVLIDFAPDSFTCGNSGLTDFDGTKLYENPDDKKRYHGELGTLRFNFARYEVSNFIIANALYMIEKFHVDGLNFVDTGSMLYLDYGKGDGQWSANIYGGNEDLDGIEILKHLNSIVHKRNPGVITMSDGQTVFPKMTDDLEDGGLGFDLKQNLGFINDFRDYMSFDPYFRAHHQNELTFSMVYAYSDKFILPFEIKGYDKWLPGEKEDKEANLRLGLSYMYTHPGRKLTGNTDSKQIRELITNLNELYIKEPALRTYDDSDEGFEWINCITADKCFVSFLRNTDKKKDTLVVVANFAGVEQNLRVGVPYEGTYKEIFISDDVRFGGEKATSNNRSKKAIAGRWDGRDYSIKTKLPKLSLVIYKFEEN